MTETANTPAPTVEQLTATVKEASAGLTKAAAHIKTQDAKIAELQSQLDGQVKSAGEKKAALSTLAPEIADLLIKQGFNLEEQRANIIANIEQDNTVLLAKTLKSALAKTVVTRIGEPVGSEKSAADNPMAAADEAHRRRMEQ